jgi:hypothetical protein
VRVLAAIISTVVLACGCGSGKGSPRPVQGAAREVASVVSALEKATAHRDFEAICRDLLSSSVRRQAGADECPDLMRARAKEIRKPHIRIRSIEVSRAGAIVRVSTTAEGQARVDDVIRLVREGGSYRIASLGR